MVKDGALTGVDLNTLIQTYGATLLGEKVVQQFGNDFPILIKFIDAKKDLSIQVHPNNALAAKRHNSFGKTEMWYIMDADPDAQLIVGFKKDIAKDEYKKSIADNTLLELLNYESVTAGDTFFINTGKIHAIGAGTVLAEIQQTSDITYRVFDFNRKDKTGNLRELHTEEALDAIDYQCKADFKVDYRQEPNQRNQMVVCPYFKTDYLDLNTTAEFDLKDRDVFTIYICVSGAAYISNAIGTAHIRKGETLLLPACSAKARVETDGCKLLEVTI